jgi:hypothetical protein
VSFRASLISSGQRTATTTTIAPAATTTSPTIRPPRRSGAAGQPRPRPPTGTGGHGAVTTTRACGRFVLLAGGRVGADDDLVGILADSARTHDCDDGRALTGGERAEAASRCQAASRCSSSIQAPSR